MDTPLASPERPGHRRNKSAQVLKSIIRSSSRPPSPKKTSGPRSVSDEIDIYHDKESGSRESRQHGHNQPRVFTDVSNSKPLSPKKQGQYRRSPSKHDDPWNVPETQLSTEEAQMLAGQSKTFLKEKENTTPPRMAQAEPFTPIWAQFTSQAFQNSQDTTQTSTRPKHIHSKSEQNTGLYRSDDGGSCESMGPSLFTLSPTKSRPVGAVARYVERSPQRAPVPQTQGEKDLDAAFEAVLVSRNIPEHRRQNMRTLDPKIKRDFIKHDSLSAASAKQQRTSDETPVDKKEPRSGRKRSNTLSEDCNTENEQSGSPSKRSRSRTRGFTLTKRDRSRPRSTSRPRSLMSLKNWSSSSVNSITSDTSKEVKPKQSGLVEVDNFVTYLKNAIVPQKVEVGKIHKLRLLLRNETVSWVDKFDDEGGMNALVALLRKTLQIEWREEHEDLLLHEVLLCLKALCTTQKALDRLSTIKSALFPELLGMLFDEERKGPSEYSTRSVVFEILFTHLASGSHNQRSERAVALLSYLADAEAPEADRPNGFIAQMQQRRPYQKWCKELSTVTKEVFWIFLHHLNVISLAPNPGMGSYVTASSQNREQPVSYMARHFPQERPPVPAAPYIGGVEWDATNYMTAHLDLMNAIIASRPTIEERNNLREDLRASGFEKVMGRTLRLCKEKFYGMVHEALRTWVAAAAEDGWPYEDVRQGPMARNEEGQARSSVPVSPGKKPVPPPKLELPKLASGENVKGAWV